MAEPVRDATSRSAALIEVFSSIQGEGPHVGRRHFFIRFGACNLTCRYCDTPEWKSPPIACRVHRRDGRVESHPNPLSVSAVADIVDAFLEAEGRPDAVSLTGGEPLLHAEFLEALLPALDGRDLAFYLETNGILPDALRRVLPWVQTVSMDIKLARTLERPREPDDLARLHREFLAIAHEREVFCKVVIDGDVTDAEIRWAAGVVASVDDRIPLILQPVTPYGPVQDVPSAERLITGADLARQVLADVRVIPQTHPALGLR